LDPGCNENRAEQTVRAIPKVQEPLYTIDEYLTFERASQEKHQYLDGRILAMAGESDAHGDITVNIVGILHAQLRGKPCRARTKDTKVRSGPAPRLHGSKSGLFSYPDVLMICGEPQYHDDQTDVILNPTAIIEVLSPSTEAFDRGEKFVRYQLWNPTLSDYVLVTHHRAQVEHFSRNAAGRWSYDVVFGLESKITIPSIGCTLSLAEIYERVKFPPPKEEPSSEQQA
jgi:Uma2 family endonuclease